MPKGYSLDALADVVYPSTQSALTVNLNTLVGRDNEGKYIQPTSASATTANNYPIQEAGILEVLRHAANGANNVMQRYTTFSSRRLFIRSQADGSGNWTEWDEYARMSEIYKQVYPVGIEIQFAISTNPNTLFPGTTWTQITDGRVVRGAVTNSTGGNAANGDIGTIGGSESITIAVGNLPAHSHTIAHTHDAPQHTHAFPAHVHTMAHTHSVPAHSHTASGSTGSAGAHTHTVSGTAASAGDHDHAQRAWQDGGGVTRDWYIDRNVFNKAGFTNLQSRTEAGGAHTHSVSGTAASAGAHTHTVSVTVNQQAAMTTGGVSTANTGQTGGTTGNASAVTTGGPSAASSGNTGSGTAIAVTNPFRRVAIWRRTA